MPLVALALAVVVVLLACEGRPPPPPPCAPVAQAGHAAVDGRVAVILDESGAGLDALAAQLAPTLGAMWGGQVDLVRAEAANETALRALLAQPGARILVSASGVARDVTGAAPANGFVTTREDDASGPLIVVHAQDPRALAYGAYALLETLGARFFHPKEALLPPLGAPHFPDVLDDARVPLFAERGAQLHTVHPTEWLAPFLIAGDENLADATQYLDWMVQTGQNHVQLFLLETLDFATYPAHAQEIVRRAHDRGLTVGAVVQLWGAASLQHGYSLVQDTEAETYGELDASLEDLMAIAPWDMIELSLGEFFAGEPARVIGWLDYATVTVAERYPATYVSITNHVGNYEDLYVEHAGETVFYYHLGGFADPRLVNTAHTVFWFDLYRPWGMYGHDDGYRMHHEFLVREAGERPVRYMPESAYWITADLDVPLFLPEYVHSRFIDITGLYRDLERAGRPPLRGHVMFSSGHEWGYWLTDYLAARMQWRRVDDVDLQERAGVEDWFAFAFAPLGECADDVSSALTSYTSTQTTRLFDEKRVPFLSAEDLHDDLGNAVGLLTQVPRPTFGSLQTLDQRAKAAFLGEHIEPLEATAREMLAAEQQMRGACDRLDASIRSFCEELHDGMRITRLRAQHSATLYRAALAPTLDDADALVSSAKETRAAAGAVLARRALSYRFPYAVLAERWSNPTRYPYGLLYQTHQQCLWIRQEQQLAHFLETGRDPGLYDVDTCLD